MSQFNPDLWRERAWARFSRALRRGGDELTLTMQWSADVLAIGDLAKLIDWCTSKALSVTFEKKVGGVYDASNKNIMISSRLLPRRQVILLLHECGHHLIGRKEHHGRFAMGYPQTDPEVIKTFHHRVAVLEEEMEAWHRGWNLSQRLELNLDRDTFDVVRLECIKTYMKWGLQRPVKKKEG